MKKILFIHHGSAWGGAPNSLIRLIKSLDYSDYEAKVLLLKPSIVADKLNENGIRFDIASSVFYTKYYQYFTHSEADYLKWYQVFPIIRLGLFWLLSRYYFARKELARHEYDLVHLNSSVLTDWLAPAKEKGKVIIHIREPFRNGKCDLLKRIFKYQIFKYADRIIAISKDNATRINMPDKTSVVYNYSEIENFQELNIEKYSSKSVLYVGGSESIKGFYTLVDALKYIHDDIRVYFSGYFSKILADEDGGVNAKVKKLLKSIRHRRETLSYFKIEKSLNAEKVGLLTDINDYIDKSVCLVSPFSIPHFSRPIIEAFGRRKPAIATSIEGMDELVEDGLDGILVEKDNAKALADAINYLCLNPQIAKRMGDYGFKVAQEKFSQNNINQICSIYRNLLD